MPLAHSIEELDNFRLVRHRGDARLVEQAWLCLSVGGAAWLYGPSGRRRCSTPAFCVALLCRGEELARRDAVHMVYYAFLAERVASGLRPERWGAAVVADLQLAALTELGNAYRVTGDVALARRACERAHEVLDRGSHDPRLNARLLSLAASLLGEEGRLEDALPRLARARELYGAAGRPVESARAAIGQGIYTGCLGRFDEAIRLLSAALEEFPHDEYYRLAVTGIYSLCVFLVEKGDDGSLRRARILLWHHRKRFDEEHMSELGLMRYWLRGRIHVALGEPARAAADLTWATAGFAIMNQPLPAAVAALDYVALCLELGFMDEVRVFVKRAVDVLEPLGPPRETLISLWTLQRELETDQPLPLLRPALARAIRDLEADPRADPMSVKRLAPGP